MEKLLFALMQDAGEPSDFDPNGTDGGHFPTYGTGDKAEKAFGIHKLKEETARTIYGAIALGSAITTILCYLLMNKFVATKTYKFIVYVHQGVWWPVAVTWICLYFFDGMLLRHLFEIAVTLSLAGPMFLYWVGLANTLVLVDDWKQWKTAGTWIYMICFIAYSLASVVY